MPGARRWGGGERGRAVPGDHQHRLPSAVQRPEAAAPLTPPFSARLLPPGECPGPGGGSSPPAPGPAWHRHLRRRSGGCCSVKGPSALPLRPGPACRGALGSPHASRCYCNAGCRYTAGEILFRSKKLSANQHQVLTVNMSRGWCLKVLKLGVTTKSQGSRLRCPFHTTEWEDGPSLMGEGSAGG
ncbi:uncharacterized protein LOC128841575 isoform X2 [Malaclemys terrapin pileata]|uniref:uncharacterized protein LOC128841575 isoform X2 n=1 Tax=Malaclemys terrapin pileata TaxID=2991368 RepID=UPI0023A8B7DE|nr:uncharacterized protein LOC128841575 isoform X2 [Malaclemys terrapin pileata]